MYTNNYLRSDEDMSQSGQSWNNQKHRYSKAITPPYVYEPYEPYREANKNTTNKKLLTLNTFRAQLLHKDNLKNPEIKRDSFPSGGGWANYLRSEESSLRKKEYKENITKNMKINPKLPNLINNYNNNYTMKILVLILIIIT